MDQPSAEGTTPLDLDEAEGLIPSHIETRGELNAWELANLTKAVIWLDEKRAEPILTIDFVRELHKRMFDETWKWAGTFRKTEKTIGVLASTIQEELLNLLKDTEHWIKHHTYTVDEIAWRFHHRLVSIHPFPNGNGRHARLMTEALQDQLGVPRFTWGRANLVSGGRTRKAYLSALRAADKGDYKELIVFVRS